MVEGLNHPDFGFIMKTEDEKYCRRFNEFWEI